MLDLGRQNLSEKKWKRDENTKMFEERVTHQTFAAIKLTNATIKLFDFQHRCRLHRTI